MDILKGKKTHFLRPSNLKEKIKGRFCNYHMIDMVPDMIGVNIGR